MSDLFSNQLAHLIPWIAIVAGLTGSLHCVGMCGGLVTASSKTKMDLLRYQGGRLLGYLLLGITVGALGNTLKVALHNSNFAILPSVLIGLMFIFVGMQNLFYKNLPYPGQKYLSKIYKMLWQDDLKLRKYISVSFFTGFISIFLPCGLLYGIAIATLSLQNMFLSMIAMLFFWLGTIPAMLAAPSVVKKIMSPFKNDYPKIYSLFFIFLGLFTIVYRLVTTGAHHHH